VAKAKAKRNKLGYLLLTRVKINIQVHLQLPILLHPHHPLATKKTVVATSWHIKHSTRLNRNHNNRHNPHNPHNPRKHHSSKLEKFLLKHHFFLFPRTPTTRRVTFSKPRWKIFWLY
jgi:hypothetical protein